MKLQKVRIGYIKKRSIFIGKLNIFVIQTQNKIIIHQNLQIIKEGKTNRRI